eukprot:gene13002-7737_t
MDHELLSEEFDALNFFQKISSSMSEADLFAKEANELVEKLKEEKEKPFIRLNELVNVYRNNEEIIYYYKYFSEETDEHIKKRHLEDKKTYLKKRIENHKNNGTYSKVDHDDDVERLTEIENKLQELKNIEEPKETIKLKNFIREWKNELEKLDMSLVNPNHYIKGPNGYKNPRIFNSFHEKCKRVLKNLSCLPPFPKESQPNSIPHYESLLKIRILSIKTYAMDTIKTDLTIKKGIEMEEKIQKLQEENKVLNKLFVIAEIRKRLEKITDKIKHNTGYNHERPTSTGILRHLSTSNSANSEWNYISQKLNVNDERKKQIRSHVQQLYGQLSGEIHNVKKYGFSQENPLTVSDEHLGNSEDRLIALKLLFEEYHADESYYEDEESGNQIKMKDINFKL